MTVEQFVVGSILTVAVTAFVLWQFLFKPRLDDLEADRLKWRTRAEVAEHEIRSADEDGMKLVGNHNWGNPLEFLEGKEWGE